MKNRNLDKTGLFKWEDQKNASIATGFCRYDRLERNCPKKQVPYINIYLRKRKEQNPCVLRGVMVYAGALNYYRKKFGLPEVYSDNGSFLFWIPDTINITNEYCGEQYSG